LHLIGQYF